MSSKDLKSLRIYERQYRIGREYIHGCRVGVNVSKLLFTRQPFKKLSQISYMHSCRVSTQNCYLHGSRSRANSDIYMVAVCPHKLVIYMAAIQEQNTCCQVYTKIAIYTAAVQEPNRLYTLLSGVYIKLLLTRQPFKSQIETTTLTALSAIKQRFFIG